MDDATARSAPPILHRKKADLVYEYLREQIINGTYAPGKRMRLAELAAETKLSQMPIREALVRLEREGLLESEPHKGMRVVRLSLDEARDLFEIRCELEGLSAYRAAKADDPELVDDLEAINNEFADAFQRKDFTAMGSINWMLHRRLLQAANSAPLTRVLEDHWAATWRYRSGYRIIPGRAEQTIQEHKAIIAAIRNKDPEAARHAARTHIQRAGADLALAVSETSEE